MSQVRGIVNNWAANMFGCSSDGKTITVNPNVKKLEKIAVTRNIGESELANELREREKVNVIEFNDEDIE